MFESVLRYATKRQSQGDNEISQPRSTNGHPSTNERSVLGEDCLFCGKQRKRKSQKNEALKQCLTMNGCKSIVPKRNVIPGSLDLEKILLQRKQNTTTVRQVEDEEEQTSTRKKHNEAFQISLRVKSSRKKSPCWLATAIFSFEFLALG